MSEKKNNKSLLNFIRKNLYYLVIGVSLVIIATVIAAIVGAVVGLVILVDCWRRCSNIIEIIFLPLVMIMVFCMIILFWWVFLLLMGFATKSDDR